MSSSNEILSSFLLTIILSVDYEYQNSLTVSSYFSVRRSLTCTSNEINIATQTFSPQFSFEILVSNLLYFLLQYAVPRTYDSDIIIRHRGECKYVHS
jgi:hypothetical protein